MICVDIDQPLTNSVDIESLAVLAGIDNSQLRSHMSQSMESSRSTLSNSESEKRALR